ncbi:TPA: hypothetical protein JD194_06755 [Cronobacter sakazakii]|nr:hypothetical protein [Cronobacter sakazakii]
MSTISTEQAKDLRNAFECWQQDYDPVEDKEQYEMFGLGVVAMDELLALRKERELAEPVGYFGRFDADDETLIDQCSPNTKGAFPLYAEPPAPVALTVSKDEIRKIFMRNGFTIKDGQSDLKDYVYDAAFELISSLKLPAPVAVPDEVLKSLDLLLRRSYFRRWVKDPQGYVSGSIPVRDLVNVVLFADACRAAMLNQSQPVAEADTTSQQFESLAGKAVVPAGWKLVPIELTKEMRRKIHPFAEALCHGCGRQVVADCVDNVTASWNDMLAVAPEPCK